MYLYINTWRHCTYVILLLCKDDMNESGHWISRSFSDFVDSLNATAKCEAALLYVSPCSWPRILLAAVTRPGLRRGPRIHLSHGGPIDIFLVPPLHLRLPPRSTLSLRSSHALANSMSLYFCRLFRVSQFVLLLQFWSSAPSTLRFSLTQSRHCCILICTVA